MKPSVDINEKLRDGFTAASAMVLTQLIERVKNGGSLTPEEWRHMQAGRELLFYREHPNIVASLAEIGRAFGMSERQAKRWRAQGMPKTDEGRYDIVEIARWEYQRRVPVQAAESRPRDELAELKAESARLDLAERKGELVSRTDVEQDGAEKVRQVNRRLSSMGHKLAPVISGLDEQAARKAIDDEVNQILNEFAGGFVEPEPSAETPAPKKRGRRPKSQPVANEKE